MVKRETESTDSEIDNLVSLAPFGCAARRGAMYGLTEDEIKIVVG
jgi:hypothetical protein